MIPTPGFKESSSASDCITGAQGGGVKGLSRPYLGGGGFPVYGSGMAPPPAACGGFPGPFPQPNTQPFAMPPGGVGPGPQVGGVGGLSRPGLGGVGFPGYG